MTIEQQFTTIFLIIGSGFCIGILFDGFRVIKSKIKLSKWVVFFVDVNFGIFSALLIFIVLLWINYGQLRLIIFPIFFLGLWIYFLTTSKYFVKLWIIIFNILHQIWSFVLRVIQLLIIRPIIFLYKLVIIAITFLITALFAIGSISQKILITPIKMLYSKTSTKIHRKEGFSSLLKKIFKYKRR